MRQVTVRLFGSLELSWDSHAPAVFPTRRARSLFAFLAFHQGQSFSRDALCGTFWPELSESAARKGLRTALWRLRQALKASGIEPDEVLHPDASRVGFLDRAGVWVDSREFEVRTRVLTDLRRPELDATSAESLDRATRLYRGSLLEDLYDDWCEQDRERLQLAFLATLECLATYHEREAEWEQAIARADHLLRHDPLREHIHRQLMRCHYAMGNRPAAIRQYQRCVGILERELNVPPMAETQLLFNRILEGHPSVASKSEEGRRTPPGPGLRNKTRSLPRSWLMHETPFLSEREG
jgi:DNA-binding SARP family transcriptional activator